MALIFNPKIAAAQINNTNLQGAQLMQLVNSGSTDLAADALSQQSGLPINDTGKLLQGLQNGNNIDVGNAGNLLDGIISGQSGINSGNVDSIIGMVEKLQSGQGSPAAITNLIGEVAQGQMSGELGEALSNINNLGNMQNMGNMAQVFNNPDIKQQLTNIFGQGDEGSAGQVLQSISQIAQIAMNPQAAQQAAAQSGEQAAAQAIAQGLTQALQQGFPELAQALEQVLGGSQNILNMLSSLLGGGGAPTSTPSPSGEGIEDLNPGIPDPGVSCGSCNCNECPVAINRNHRRIRAHVTSEFEQHRNWIVTTYFLKYIAPAMMLMTEQFVNNMMQQVQIIGTFFDAKHQLETQRLFQLMTAQAHRDYHPSEGLCEIGTNVRSLAASERKSHMGQMAFADRMMQRQTAWGENISDEGGVSDRKSRLDLFINKFCDPLDNAGGLKKVCAGGGKNKEQINMDVDFTSAFENKLTLDVDFTKTEKNTVTPDEENIFALSANLFANEILPTIPDVELSGNNIRTNNIANYYLDIRAIAAKRSVAQNSFAAITAQKAEGDEQVAPFLKAVLAEAGIAPEEIEDRLGEKPSYFAQMEVLTKDLYQNPSFYSNLYDKPVNIERKGAALQAIELMQDRDIYKSLMRSEAVLAVMLETLIQKEHDRVSKELRNVGLDAEAFQGTGPGS